MMNCLINKNHSQGVGMSHFPKTVQVDPFAFANKESSLIVQSVQFWMRYFVITLSIMQLVYLQKSRVPPSQRSCFFSKITFIGGFAKSNKNREIILIY